MLNPVSAIFVSDNDDVLNAFISLNLLPNVYVEFSVGSVFSSLFLSTV